VNMMFALPAILGLLVGFLLAMTGAGGAIISVPLLVFVVGLSVADAAPVALLAVCMSAAVGAILGLRSGVLRYKAAMVMSLTGLLLSPLGIWVAGQVPNRPLTVLFALVLAYVSVTMYRSAQQVLSGHEPEASVGPPCMLHEVRGKLTWTLPCFRSMVVSGGLAGFLSGLLGVGGGFVIVPALKRVTNLPARAIVATSLGVIALVSLGGAVTAAMLGRMTWDVAIPFALGSLLGMLLGRQLAQRLSGPRLQQAFAFFAGGVAIVMFVNALLAG
jgi:uncharacterized protein